MVATAYLAHRVNEKLGPNPDRGAIAAWAREIGLPSKQTLSQIRTGARKSVAVDTFDTFAAYWGKTHDELLAEALEWWKTRHPGEPLPSSRETRVVRDDGRPVMANLAGWAELEARARAMKRFRHVSDEAWQRVREASAAGIDRANLTESVVGDWAAVIDRALAGEGLDTSEDD